MAYTRKSRVSKLSMSMLEAFREIGEEVIPELRLKDDKRVIDLWLPRFHLACEINGRFFHCDKRHYRPGMTIMMPGSKTPIPVERIWEKDEKKRIMLVSRGLNVHYIWEDEIRKMGALATAKLAVRYYEKTFLPLKPHQKPLNIALPKTEAVMSKRKMLPVTKESRKKKWPS